MEEKSAIEIFEENKRKKCNKYPLMKCNHIINCPCYNGDGYTYRFDSIEFNFCEVCNNKLFNQMLEQKELEKECETK